MLNESCALSLQAQINDKLFQETMKNLFLGVILGPFFLINLSRKHDSSVFSICISLTPHKKSEKKLNELILRKMVIRETEMHKDTI